MEFFSILRIQLGVIRNIFKAVFLNNCSLNSAEYLQILRTSFNDFLYRLTLAKSQRRCFTDLTIACLDYWPAKSPDLTPQDFYLSGDFRLKVNSDR